MAGEPDQDHRLVELALAGDHDAFGELVTRHQALVAAVAYRYGVPRDEIEDVASEVFLKVFRKLGSYRPHHAFSTWLYRVAVNHVLDQGRRRAREAPRTALSESLADPSADAGDVLEQSERLRLLRAAMRRLTPPLREMLYLVHVEGLKVKQACERLGIPSGTGKVRLMRGREKLKQLLCEMHPGYFARNAP